MRSSAQIHQNDLRNVRLGVFAIKKDDDGAASAHWKALRAAKTPEAEIERYNMLQGTRRTEAEVQHDKDLHELRMKRFQTKRSKECREQREAEPWYASSTEEEAQTLRYKELQIETLIKELSQQNQHLRKIRNSMAGDLQLHRGRACEPKAPPSPPSETSNVPETSRAPLPIPLGSGHAAIPSLKRSDTEVFKVPARSPSPPPNTQWRDRTRQRERLNLNFSRIETHFLLTHEFIDDVNAMLDRFEGWSALEIADIAYAFKKDCDNRGRIVEFVDLGSRKWVVQLLNPLNPERRDSGMLCPFRCSDNPRNLCQQPGSKACSNKAHLEERAADLRRFRDQQMMPPPPLPPRSDKRTTPPRPPQVAGLQATSAITSRTANTSRPVNSPRTGPSSMSEEGMRPEHTENAERSGLKMWTQVEQVKGLMSQIKTQAGVKQGGPAEGREMVRQFLQNLKLTPTPSERPETSEDSKNSEHSNAPESLKLPEQPRPPERLKFPEQPVPSEQPGTPEQSTASVPPTILEPSSTQSHRTLQSGQRLQSSRLGIQVEAQAPMQVLES